MQIARYRPHRTARRYDAGTPPVPSIYGGLAGVDLILETGVPEIRDHVRGLVRRLVDGCAELGATVVAPEGEGPLVCVRSTDAPALVAALGADGIVTSERDSSLRVSLHLYNTAEDVDAVLAGLVRHRSLLA
jgi:selenocysteine lyase/cysteine desulfurase